MLAENLRETVSRKQSHRITWEGASVLLDINDGDRLLFARLTPGSNVKIGNKNCSLKPLIGCAFGSTFRVEVGSSGPYLSRVTSSSEGNGSQESMDFLHMEESRDNRALVDNNTAQSLTGEDIDDMRRYGWHADHTFFRPPSKEIL